MELCLHSPTCLHGVHNDNLILPSPETLNGAWLFLTSLWEEVMNHESLFLYARQVVRLVYEAVPVYLAEAATVLGTERRLMSCLIHWAAPWFVCIFWHDFVGFHTAVYGLDISTNEDLHHQHAAQSPVCGVHLVRWLIDWLINWLIDCKWLAYIWPNFIMWCNSLRVQSRKKAKFRFIFFPSTWYSRMSR